MKKNNKATSTKTNFDKASFLTETENLRIRKITSQQISKKNKISLERKWVYRMRNVKTACWRTWTDYGASIEAVVVHQRHCSTSGSVVMQVLAISCVTKGHSTIHRRNSVPIKGTCFILFSTWVLQFLWFYLSFKKLLCTSVRKIDRFLYQTAILHLTLFC